MNSTSFAYWLQGFIEINNPPIIIAQELTIIKDHLKIIIKDDEFAGTKGPYLSPNNFVMWLDGLVNGNGLIMLESKHTSLLKSKLNSVFNKITPDRSNGEEPYVPNKYC